MSDSTSSPYENRELTCRLISMVIGSWLDPLLRPWLRASVEWGDLRHFVPHHEGSMIPPVIAQHIPRIRALCKEFGVRKLEIFGSAVTDRFDPAHSDVDFIVTYPKGYDVGPWARRPWELQSRLESVLGIGVDMIRSTAIRKPRFERRVRDSRTTRYAA